MKGSDNVMTVCIPVTTSGQVGHGWGRTDRVALAETDSGTISDWQEIQVSWGVLHDQDGEGAHHARVVRFLRDHHVDTVIANGMGAGMQHTLERLGVSVHLGAAGDARTAVTSAT
jgi:predicted Fe-Mo cluster-binding NifX family protein